MAGIHGASSSVGGAGLGLWLRLWVNVNPMVHEVQSAPPPENEEEKKRLTQEEIFLEDRYAF